VARRPLATLARLVVPREREHVRQVLAELACSRKAALRHTHARRRVLGSQVGTVGVAGVDDIVLAVF